MIGSVIPIPTSAPCFVRAFVGLGTRLSGWLSWQRGCIGGRGGEGVRRCGRLDNMLLFLIPNSQSLKNLLSGGQLRAHSGTSQTNPDSWSKGQGVKERERKWRRGLRKPWKGTQYAQKCGCTYLYKHSQIHTPRPNKRAAGNFSCA